MRSRGFSVGPRLDDLEQEAERAVHFPDSEAHILRFAGSALHLAYCENEKQTARKVRLLLLNTIATVALVVATLPLIGAAVAAAGFQSTPSSRASLGAGVSPQPRWPRTNK